MRVEINFFLMEISEQNITVRTSFSCKLIESINLLPIIHKILYLILNMLKYVRKVINMSKIGDFVKEERKKNGLNQEDLALYAGVSTKFISQLENGKEALKLDKINQVLAIFDAELTPTKKY